MEIAIEKQLQKMSLIDYATIKNLLHANGYKYINDKIKNMKHKGLLTTLKRGLYVYNSPYLDKLVSKEIIGNNLLGPSYISYDYALSYHGLIPERIEEVTSATSKRSKNFSTPYGTFSYRHINKKLFSLGLMIVSTKQGGFMIATPEKALCDKLMIITGIKITSKKKMLTLLEDDLRIDMDELSGVDLKMIERYAIISKSTKIYFLLKVLKEIS